MSNASRLDFRLSVQTQNVFISIYKLKNKLFICRFVLFSHSVQHVHFSAEVTQSAVNNPPPHV